MTWAALRPEEVAGLLDGLDVFWCIAGGWAIDLLVGRETRVHGDIDVLVLRPDAGAVREHLDRAGWDIHTADPPGTLRPWPVGETLPPHVHDVWCRPTPDSPWALQLMVDERDSDTWVSRRDPRLRRPVGEIWHRLNGLPVLVPEVQLLYKAKAPRPKDEHDFQQALTFLSSEQRAWLDSALGVAHPEHSWRRSLGG